MFCPCASRLSQLAATQSTTITLLSFSSSLPSRTAVSALRAISRSSPRRRWVLKSLQVPVPFGPCCQGRRVASAARSNFASWVGAPLTWLFKRTWLQSVSAKTPNMSESMSACGPKILIFGHLLLKNPSFGPSVRQNVIKHRGRQHDDMRQTAQWMIPIDGFKNGFP
jgi:hypothetical protein